MRLIRSDMSAGTGGQVFLEYALVLPLVLLLLMSTLQVGLLSYARGRFEAAVAQAARSYQVHGSIERARQAAALVMVPASLRMGTGLSHSLLAGKLQSLAGVLDGMGADHAGMLGSLVSGLSRYIYAFAHTRITACFPKTPGDPSALLIERGDPVRLDISFDVPLLMPVVAGLFADGLPRARSDSAEAALAASPYRGLAGGGAGRLLDQGYNRFAKRRLYAATAISWGRARHRPEPAAICVL